MRQRTRVAVNVGNLLELFGAACGVYGVAQLAGFKWALILAGVLLVLAAELIYDGHVWRVPLPRKPDLHTWREERRQALQMRWYRLKARRRAHRQVFDSQEG